MVLLRSNHRLQPYLGEAESAAGSFQSQETSERLGDLEEPSEVHGPTKTESLGRLLIMRAGFQASGPSPRKPFQETKSHLLNSGQRVFSLRDASASL